MPSIVEHDKFNSTKEKTEVERYLIRIIERYFQIETEYSRSAMESIVQESFTRIKRYMHKYKGFIFSFNRKTGHINIDIKFFNGEPEINKNTAFNKDFGDEENTICEGNDKRLYDARQPLEHTHSLNDIINLDLALDTKTKEAIYEIINGLDYSHAHTNESVLNMLEYTGSMAKIDLILLEDLKSRVNETLKQIKYHKIEAYNYYNEKQDYLNLQLELLIRYFDELKQDVILSAINWLGTAYSYCMDKGQETLITLFKNCKPYAAKEYSQKVFDNFSKIDNILAEDTFNLNTIVDSPDSYISSNPLVYICHSQKSIKELFDNSTMDTQEHIWEYDNINNKIIYNYNNNYYSRIYKSNELFTDYVIKANFSSTEEDNAAFITLGEIDDNRISVLISPGGVNANGFTTPPIPHISIVNNFNREDVSLIYKKNLTNTSLNSWSSYTYGITVLIKKSGSILKIWYSIANNPWNDYSNKEIEESSEPFIQIDLSNSLPDVVNTQVNIGFGTFAQKINISNIYIYAINDTYGYSTYIGGEVHTSYSSSSAFTEYQKHTIGHRIKTYFQYKDNNNRLIKTTIPFKHISANGKEIIVNTRYNKNTGYIDAYYNTTVNIPVNLNCPAKIIKGNDVYIPVINLINNSYEDTFEILDKYDCDIPILTETLHNELEELLNGLNIGWKNRKYLVRGLVEESYAYSDFKLKTDRNMYYELRLNGQFDGDSYYVTMKVDDNNPQNLLVQEVYNTDIGFILHYKNTNIADNINNPQIYFQVLGRKEYIN